MARPFRNVGAPTQFGLDSTFRHLIFLRRGKISGAWERGATICQHMYDFLGVFGAFRGDGFDLEACRFEGKLLLYLCTYPENFVCLGLVV